MVDEVEDLKGKIPDPSALPPTPNTLSPPAPDPAACPDTAPAEETPAATSPAVATPSQPAADSSSGWQTAGKRKKKGPKGPPNQNRAAWLYVSNSRRQDGKLIYQAKNYNWQKHLASLLPKGSDLLQGVRRVDNPSDTRMTLACTSRAARAALHSVLCTSSSV